MKCPHCSAKDTRVLDSRNLKDGLMIRRRRKCDSCEKRFTTYETIEVTMPMIVKLDGRREEYNQEKIRSGITKACQKTTVSTAQIDRVIENIEKRMLEISDKEISSKELGNLVMMYLRHLHPAAYIRFASVYRKFQDVEEFVSDLKHDELIFTKPTGDIHANLE
jgi:transcriptional repressor NrdR